MKQMAFLGLIMIFLITIVACSENNTAEGNKETEIVDEAAMVDESPMVDETPMVNASPKLDESPNLDETSNADETPIVEEDVHLEEHAVEHVDVAKPNIEPEVIVEPKVEVELVVPEPEVVEPKVESKVEPEEALVEQKEEAAVIEPTPIVATPKIHKVEIVNFAFSPENLEISIGDIVEFINLDSARHSAVEDNGVFDTGLLRKGESKQITFSEAGEFAYYCGPHPDMRAKIIVK